MGREAGRGWVARRGLTAGAEMGIGGEMTGGEGRMAEVTGGDGAMNGGDWGTGGEVGDGRAGRCCGAAASC